MRYPDGGGLTAKQRARREQVRFEPAELFAQGVTPPQVARRLRVSRKSAYAWHARWWDDGVEGLRSKGPSGRPSRMKPEWRAWSAAELEKGPAAHGWAEGPAVDPGPGSHGESSRFFVCWWYGDCEPLNCVMVYEVAFCGSVGPRVVRIFPVPWLRVRGRD
ncbi:helix-turn-helix domain-containing protein [Streptomyces sp. CA-210063]|nr:helix-turn-helix domain-containing protein [Streptomyces sp. CA-210063]UUU29011.1 helix-turn-helix domain-containing protein [Streptomyces sp. CA-210063]